MPGTGEKAYRRPAARMREMAPMQRALRKLVASRHGDYDPHCAILDELAVRRPAHSTVTDLARFLGLSTSVPRASAA